MPEEIEVRLAVKIPAKVREALRALKHGREMAEGRPVTQAEIVAELIEHAAARETTPRV